MFWTARIVLVALTLVQVPTGLAKPGAIIEDAEASSTSERIISGWEAYPGQFPYVASLRGVTAAGAVRPCAGSVVHLNWILTSAFCILTRVSVMVRAGVTDLTTTPEYISETMEWWGHPEYSNSNGFNNIAILKLQLTLSYSILVQPIRIQPWADAFADYENEVVVASGWGSRSSTVLNTPDVLNWVYLRAISNQECSGDQSRLNENFICTRGFNVTSQSTCTEDNGGPLAHVGRDGEPVLVGIATIITGYNCSSSGNAAAFTRPGPYLSWLYKVTGIDFDKGSETTTTEVTVLPTSEVTEPPTTEASVSTITEVPKPPTTEAPKPPTTETPEPPATEVPETPTSEMPEPPATEAPEPPTTETPEPPTTEAPEPPTTKAPEPPTTEVPEPPTTEAPEPLTTEAPEPPTTEVPEPPTTEAPEPPATEVPEPPTTETPEPPTTEAPELPTTETPEPPTTEAPEPPTTEAPEPPTTEAPEPDSDEYDENSNDSDGSESREESEFGNKQVKVKLKVKVNNNVKIQ